MPRLKTESEVATMRYLREHTDIPVPEVYQYDANPYNRLGGEYILMSKVRAPAILNDVSLTSNLLSGARHPVVEGVPLHATFHVGRANGEHLDDGHPTLRTPVPYDWLVIRRPRP